MVSFSFNVLDMVEKKAFVVNEIPFRHLSGFPLMTTHLLHAQALFSRHLSELLLLPQNGTVMLLNSSITP